MSCMQFFIKRLCCLFLLLGANTYGSTLLILGDSLSAGYGIDPEKGWVNLLREDLKPQHNVINGSISGDTSGGGTLQFVPAREGDTSETQHQQLTFLKLIRKVHMNQYAKIDSTYLYV